VSDPEIRVSSKGTKEWRLNGLLHREDGPAIEWADGSKEWRLNGKEVLKQAETEEIELRILIAALTTA